MHRIVEAISRIRPIQSTHLVKETTNAGAKTFHNDRIEIRQQSEFGKDIYLTRLATELNEMGFQTNIVGSTLTAQKGKKR